MRGVRTGTSQVVPIGAHTTSPAFVRYVTVFGSPASARRCATLCRQEGAAARGLCDRWRQVEGCWRCAAGAGVVRCRLKYGTRISYSNNTDFRRR